MTNRCLQCSQMFGTLVDRAFCSHECRVAWLELHPEFTEALKVSSRCDSESIKRAQLRMCHSMAYAPRYVHIEPRDILPGEVVKTVELIPGRVFADYDKKGNLLGVEVV